MKRKLDMGMEFEISTFEMNFMMIFLIPNKISLGRMEQLLTRPNDFCHVLRIVLEITSYSCIKSEHRLDMFGSLKKAQCTASTPHLF